MATKKLFFLLFPRLVFLLICLDLTNAKGLHLGFYKKKCRHAELIAHRTVYRYITRDPTLAASLLRLHFHDCFVRGCDGSVLLDSTKKNQAEKDAAPNLTLRGLNVIDAVKSAVEKKCPGVVSCADILALAARDAVLMDIATSYKLIRTNYLIHHMLNQFPFVQIGGPHWDVPTGRRDGRVSISKEAVAELPPAIRNISVLKQKFAAKGLNVKDLAVLSGGHTIGISHCSSISDRLYNFTGKGDTDPSLDPRYAAKLKQKCKPGHPQNLAQMDPGSHRTFDESYYTLVTKRRGLFGSDAALLDDGKTRDYVKFQSRTHGSTFAQDFAESMKKMGRIGVLTGKQGEIRKRCAVVN